MTSTMSCPGVTISTREATVKSNHETSSMGLLVTPLYRALVPTQRDARGTASTPSTLLSSAPRPSAMS